MTHVLGTATVVELEKGITGSVIRPGDEEYEDARRVWNYAIDRRRRSWCGLPPSTMSHAPCGSVRAKGSPSRSEEGPTRSPGSPPVTMASSSTSAP